MLSPITWFWNIRHRKLINRVKLIAETEIRKNLIKKLPTIKNNITNSNKTY